MRWTWVLLVAWACGGGGGEGPPGEHGDGERKKPDPVTVVQTHTVARGAVIDALVASATVEAEQSADLVPAATGTVVRVTKDLGDPVSKGELLALIDNAPLDAGVLRASTQVAQLEARKKELEGLLAAGAISAKEVEDVEWQLRAARDSLRETKATADQTRLVAPFDGVVAAREIRLGEQANAGRRAFQIVDLQTLRVVASLPERDVARVRSGQPAKLTAAYDSKLQAGATVTRVAPVIDPSTGTFQITLTLEDGQTALRPGMYVGVALEVDRRSDVLVIPRPAVVYDNGRPVVYRVIPAPPEEEKAEEEVEQEEPGFLASLFGGGAPEEEQDKEPEAEDTGPKLVAERVPVKLGLVDVEQAEVLEGVGEGDLVVVIGQANLKDGARVREPKPEGAQQASPEGEPKTDAAEAAQPGEAG